MPDASAAPAARPRSLLPQEHGAWGQLAMPLLSALLIAGAAPAALLLAAATVLGFLAHEPWLVLLGHRGVRAVRQDGRRARRALWVLLLGAAATGGGGLWLAPPAARWALLLPATLAAGVIALVRAGRERTVPGELTVVTALASSGLAVALAAGAPLRAAAAATATWVLCFATSVFAVQVVLARTHARGETEPGRRHALAVALVGAGGSAVAAWAGLGWIVAAAVAPTALLSLVVCLAPFRARQLRTLGWGLVASSTTSLLVLVAGLHAGS
jgi:YwiC-like protein